MDHCFSFYFNFWLVLVPDDFSRSSMREDERRQLMGERTYRLSESTEERMREVQTQVQKVLDLPEPPTEHFVMAAIITLGLRVVSENINKNSPIQYSHPNNFHDFMARLYEFYKSQPRP